jgi:sugar lactone lactonase YvrE
MTYYPSLIMIRPKKEKHKSSLIAHCFKFFIIALLSILSFLFILSFSTSGHAFDKKEIQYLDMVKMYGDNMSLKFPIDVYTSKNGDIYIVDAGLHKVLVFNENFLPVSVIDKNNGLEYPMSITIDQKGMIYISEETPREKQKGKITVFDPLGRKKDTFKFEGFPEAESFLAIDMDIDEQGNLFLAGGSSGLLVVISRDGKFIRTIQPIEKTRDKKEVHADVARVALRGDLIYLLSEWHGHVYVYNKKGEMVHVFGKKGGSPGKLSRAQGLAIDPAEGTSYIMDYMRHTLLIFDSEGHFTNEFGGEGWGPGWFSYPKDISMDAQGRLFVADTFNHRVQVFQTRF